jgi:hypothetical protein
VRFHRLHPRQYRAKVLELRHLADSRKRAGGNVRAHSGRPNLASQCILAKGKSIAVRGRMVADDWARSLSYFWRTLDRIEADKPGLERVDDVRQIPGDVWDEFCKRLDDDDEIGTRKAEIYRYCSDTVTAACARLEVRTRLPENPHDTRVASKRRSVEGPYSKELNERIVEVLRAERKRVEARFALANALAAKHTDSLLDYTSRDDWSFRKYRDVVTPENVLHFVKTELLPWIPNFTEFEARYGFQPRKMGLPSDAMPVRLTAKADPKSGLRREGGWFRPGAGSVVSLVSSGPVRPRALHRRVRAPHRR